MVHPAVAAQTQCNFDIVKTFASLSPARHTGLSARLLRDPQGSAVVDSRFTGTVSHVYQEKEALYDQYLRQVEAQTARGREVRKGRQYPPLVAQPSTFIVAVSDRRGDPVVDAAVSGQFLRRSNGRDDVAFTMDGLASGEYRPRVTLPLHGHWDLVLQVRRNDDLHAVRTGTRVAYAHGETAS